MTPRSLHLRPSEVTPQRLQVRIFQGHQLDTLAITELEGFLQPAPGLLHQPQLAGVAGQVVPDNPFLRESVCRWEEGIMRLPSTFQLVKRERALNSPEHPFRRLLDDGLRVIDPNIPFLGLGVDLEANLQHVRMNAEGRSDFLQLFGGFVGTTQFQPALCCLNVVAGRRLEFCDHSG